MTGESEHVHNHASQRAGHRKNLKVPYGRVGKKGSKMAGLAGGRAAPYIKSGWLCWPLPSILTGKRGALAEALRALLYFEGSLIHIDDSRLPGLVTDD